MADDFDDPFDEQRAFPRYFRARARPGEPPPLARVRVRLAPPLSGFGRAREATYEDEGPVVTATETSWIEIRLLDEEGNPVADAEYEIELADGSPRTGTLDANGRARLEDIAPGSCKVSFSRLPEAAS